MRVVISQPMLFPWVGLFEQVRLADAYVHYDDVAFSKGSFVNRVQIKTPKGTEWLTVPLANRKLGNEIRAMETSTEEDWRAKHAAFLRRNLEGAPFAEDALRLVGDVYSLRTSSLGDIVIASMEGVWRWFGIAPRTVAKSSDLGIGGSGTGRVLAIVKHFGGDVYVTGHGAKDYLDHEAFEKAGVRVEYMEYQRRPYPQLHGEFTPYVSILDLIANRGRAGIENICSSTVPWREFVQHG